MKKKRNKKQNKTGECFPDLLESPSYTEKNEYVRRILNNKAFISYK